VHLPLTALLACALFAAPELAQPEGGAADAGVSDAAVADAAVADAGPCPEPGILEAAMEADLQLREKSDCNADELARLSAAVKAFDGCASKVKQAKVWAFPVANVTPGESLGGQGGSGFIRNPNIQCYVTPWAGHPAHDLFVDDPHQTSRDKRGRPFPALAVEDAWVLVARDGWQPGDVGRGGNYLMLYLPGRRQIAYYAHLDSLVVKVGERVAAGQVLGMIGRTGRNAAPARSQTHLHFGLWDAATFRPVNSFPLLRAARTVAVSPPEP
jgi:hypothetical protein